MFTTAYAAHRRGVQELKSGNYKLEKFCMEPTSFTVKEESSFKGGETEFVKTKLMTRLTYTLDAVSARAAAEMRGVLGFGSGEQTIDRALNSHAEPDVLSDDAGAA